MSRTLLAIDVEASGLGPQSYPIEIGWCALDGSRRGSVLIRPEFDWGAAAWDEMAEALHGITRAMLRRDGVPARDACRLFRDAADGCDLASDGNQDDQAWLNRLFEAEWPPQPSLRVASILAWIKPEHRRSFIEQDEAGLRPHRALADAERLAALVQRFGHV
jgi:DNA polymerase III epsilon subunit-like protein